MDPSVPAAAFLSQSPLMQDPVPVFIFLQVASGKWRAESSNFWTSLDVFLLVLIMVLFDIQVRKGQDDVSKMRIMMNQSYGLTRGIRGIIGFLIDSRNQALIDLGTRS